MGGLANNNNRPWSWRWWWWWSSLSLSRKSHHQQHHRARRQSQSMHSPQLSSGQCAACAARPCATQLTRSHCAAAGPSVNFAPPSSLPVRLSAAASQVSTLPRTRLVQRCALTAELSSTLVAPNELANFKFAPLSQGRSQLHQTQISNKRDTITQLLALSPKLHTTSNRVVGTLN